MSLLLQKPKPNFWENLAKRFLSMNLWVISPPQGFTPEQSLGIVGRPGMPRINAPQIRSLSGSPADDMKFNNTGETMTFNNTIEIMEFNE